MQGAYSYRNAFHAVSSIVQQQGLPGLMKGYWATNSVWFPWNMIYIASYERSKAALAAKLQAGRTLLVYIGCCAPLSEVLSEVVQVHFGETLNGCKYLFSTVPAGGHRLTLSDLHTVAAEVYKSSVAV